MFLALNDEQRLLIEAADNALARRASVAAARAALDGESVKPLWDVAVEAGWTGLLIGEDADGASLTAYEAMLVLEAGGRVLADARLLGHLPATAILEQAGADQRLRSALASGECRAALVDAGAAEQSPPARLRRTDAGLILDGSLRAVLDAPDADVLVVVAVGERGEPSAAIVKANAPGLTIAKCQAYDATRLLGDVSFDGVTATDLGLSPERVRDGRDLQRVLLAAEAVGAAEACLHMARDYAVDRHAFGRPIGSYQAIKHKLVEMLRRIEGGRSLLVHAGSCWEYDRGAFSVAANAARVVAGDALDYAAPENIFIHGGVGATWEHDASLFYRRAELSRRLAGGADAAALSVADGLLADRTKDDPATIRSDAAVSLAS